MRAKMYITSVERFSATCEKVNYACVGDKPYGPNGESEDNTFARYSPSGQLSITVTNPALIGTFEPGKKFYVDFTPAES